jgi:hypothetical protein
VLCQQQVKEAKEHGIEPEHNGDEFAVNISCFVNLQTLLGNDVIVKKFNSLLVQWTNVNIKLLL